MKVTTHDVAIFYLKHKRKASLSTTAFSLFAQIMAPKTAETKKTPNAPKESASSQHAATKSANTVNEDKEGSAHPSALVATNEETASGKDAPKEDITPLAFLNNTTR